MKERFHRRKKHKKRNRWAKSTTEVKSYLCVPLKGGKRADLERIISHGNDEYWSSLCLREDAGILLFNSLEELSAHYITNSSRMPVIVFCLACESDSVVRIFSQGYFMEVVIKSIHLDNLYASDTPNFVMNENFDVDVCDYLSTKALQF